jgi:hypothetical protein
MSYLARLVTRSTNTLSRRFSSLTSRPLPLIATAHPCGLIADADTLDDKRFQQAIKQPFKRPTVSEEVKKYHRVYDYFWNLAPHSATAVAPISWVAKESDRNPNQPAVILYGIAMDHEHMAGLYQTLLTEHELQSPETDFYLAETHRLVGLLKKSAKQEAAQTYLLNPSAEFSQHLQEQFFTNYSAEAYLQRATNGNAASSLLNELLMSANQLTQHIQDQLASRPEPVATAIRKQINTLPPWGAQTQGRLPTEDVIAAAEHALLTMGLGKTADKATLLQAIDTLIQKPGMTFKRAPSAAYTVEDNIIRFFQVYHALGVRMEEVVLVNYEDHTAYLSAHLLSLITAPNRNPRYTPMPLVEDARTLRNLANDFAELYGDNPFYYQLALQIGLRLFIARSDTTRSSGTPSGNFEVMACLRETTDMLSQLFAQSGGLPYMKIILGQGSSAPRGLFDANPAFKYNPYLLPIHWHPNLHVGITTQPGPGQSRFANPERAATAVEAINTYNIDSPERQAMADQFSSGFINWMRRFEQPGEEKLRQILNDSDSWWNQAIHQSDLTQLVLDREVGSRWRKQDASKISLFNEQRAITVFALNKEFGFPAHTVIPFVYSVRALVEKHPEAIEFLTGLYSTNHFYHKHIQETHQCLLDGDEELIAASGVDEEYQRTMIELLQEAQYYLKEISNWRLPNKCPLAKKQKYRLAQRKVARANGDPRYLAYDRNLGCYA